MNIVKVIFELDVLEDGYPPVGSESLNGILLDNGFIEINNTPFFVEEIACGDIVRCNKHPESGKLIFDSVIKEGTSKSVSIIFLEQSVKDSIYSKLRKLGCYCEYGEFGSLKMLAVEVDNSCDYQKVSEFLSEEEADGNISYSELCI